MLLLVVSFEEDLFGSMAIATTREVLNNCCTYGIEKTLMASKHKSLENLLSRPVQATNWAYDGEDFTIFIDKRDWLLMVTVHCTVPTSRVEASGLKLFNGKFILGSGLGETTNYAVVVAKVTC